MLIIYTVCYNTPQYIEPQYKLLKKFIQNDFEYIVFNNTMTDSVISDKNFENNSILQNICQKYNIKLFDVPKELFLHGGGPSSRCGTAIDSANTFLFQNYSLDSTFFLIDTDAFLLTPFDIETFMIGKKLSGRLQYRKGSTTTVKYITNHIVIYKPKDLNLNFFSFLPCRLDNVACDCGGNINYIFNSLKDNEFINWENKLFSASGNIKQCWGLAPYLKEHFNIAAIDSMDDYNLKNYILQDTAILKKTFPFCEIFENTNNNTIFLHMRAGTNWINYDIRNRNRILFNFLNKLI